MWEIGCGGGRDVGVWNRWEYRRRRWWIAGRGCFKGVSGLGGEVGLREIWKKAEVEWV